jgi:hypothetical protein
MAKAAEQAKAGRSPAQRAGAASKPAADHTPGVERSEAASDSGAPQEGSEAPDTLDGNVEGAQGESIANIALDADGFPAGSIPYYIDGERVPHHVYVEHIEDEAREANLAQLATFADGTTAPPEEG